jgi:hypothetical protein
MKTNTEARAQLRHNDAGAQAMFDSDFLQRVLASPCCIPANIQSDAYRRIDVAQKPVPLRPMASWAAAGGVRSCALFFYGALASRRDLHRKSHELTSSRLLEIFKNKHEFEGQESLSVREIECRTGTLGRVVLSGIIELAN